MEEELKKTLRREGFPFVYVWSDKPNTLYPLHKHQGKVTFFVIDGDVTFTHGIGKKISKGQRFDVPIGVEHTAIVGADGCMFVYGEEIEGDA